MNIDEVMSMFALARGKTIIANIYSKTGVHWWNDQPCTVRPGINLEQPKDCAIISIGATDESGYYANFKVDKAEQVDGELKLSGDSGVAFFKVVD